MPDCKNVGHILHISIFIRKLQTTESIIQTIKTLNYEKEYIFLDYGSYDLYNCE